MRVDTAHAWAILMPALPLTRCETEVELHLPPEMSLTRTYRPPHWTLDVPLWDYLQSVCTMLENTWLKRKQLVEALVATYRWAGRAQRNEYVTLTSTGALQRAGVRSGGLQPNTPDGQGQEGQGLTLTSTRI